MSFLETAKSKPSEPMVLRLCTVLGLPLRAQNDALRAAGFEPRFAEPAATELDPMIERAVAQMLAQHEPFPMTLLSLDATVLRSNRAASALFGAFVAEPSALPRELDMYSLLFDPRLLRPFVVDWPTLARSMLTRLHRDDLARGGDERLRARIERVLRFDGVDRSWRWPDFSQLCPPALCVRLARDDLRANFLLTVTQFSAPTQVTVEELRLESCFALDDETRALCHRMAQ